jgi:hypothetical protein
MVESEARRTTLMQLLSKLMSAEDAESLVVAAVQTDDDMGRMRAERTWRKLPSSVKTTLGQTLDAFLENPDAFVKRMTRNRPQPQVSGHRWD